MRARPAGRHARTPDPRLVARLRTAGCVFAEDEARLLEGAASGAALAELVARRVQGEPLEHLLGYVDFAGRRFLVAPGVFVPRGRSELLVDEAVALGGSVVVDLCCGCGALGLAVRDRLGGNTRLVAADVDAAALACARRNGLAEGFVGDLFDALPGDLCGRVDLLVSNTPYVPTGAIATMPVEARDHEPRRALDGGRDGLEVQRRLLAGAAPWLSPGGHLLTETSRGQADMLAEIARAAGFLPRLRRDEDLDAVVLVARRH